jgi:predicted DNA binding CopG/RHH family protein
MTARLDASSSLPAGLSPAEEAQWWDEHREYWDKTDSVDERIGPPMVHRTRPINLRLPVDMIEALKQEALQRSLPYQTLIRMWLKERLDTEAQQRGR